MSVSQLIHLYNPPYKEQEGWVRQTVLPSALAYVYGHTLLTTWWWSKPFGSSNGGDVCRINGALLGPSKATDTEEMDRRPLLFTDGGRGLVGADVVVVVGNDGNDGDGRMLGCCGCL